MRNHRSAHALSVIRDSIALHSSQSSKLCYRCSSIHATRSTKLQQPGTSQRRSQSTWAAAVDVAQSYLGNGKKIESPTLPGGVVIDPFKTVAKELKFLSSNLRQLLGSNHPLLDTVAKYYTQSEGKGLRPMLVLLISQATALTPRSAAAESTTPFVSVNDPLSPSYILADENPDKQVEPEGAQADSSILPSQRRLAEITELIHTASLLHDDVIDNSDTRRSAPSANVAFGNKMAVLAGDFMLGRASVALARLRSPEVTELISTIIANLIEGEFMQLRNTANDESNPIFSADKTISYYIQKTYLKSASLISKSCRSAAILGGCERSIIDCAYEYGKNLGLAFQLVDDMLDYTAVDNAQLGKPASADLSLGLATAPLLFAWKNRPELGELVGRKFSKDGDVAKARQIVLESDGIEQTRALAQDYADKAIDSLSAFPKSDAKDALIEITRKVMSRKK